MNERDKLVRAALKLMKENGLPPDREAEAEKAIHEAFVNTNHDSKSWNRALNDGDEREAIERWCNAVHELNAANNELTNIGSLIAIQAERHGFRELDNLLPRLNALRKEILDTLPAKSETKARDEWKKHNAAREAYILCGRFNLKAVTTKGKLWGKLAGILAGEPKSDLNYQCREFKRGTEQI